jgi:hypothetical protein
MKKLDLKHAFHVQSTKDKVDSMAGCVFKSIVTIGIDLLWMVHVVHVLIIHYRHLTIDKNVKGLSVQVCKFCQMEHVSNVNLGKLYQRTS